MAEYIGNRKVANTKFVKGVGTIDITENGEYDVSNYANANVNVGGKPLITEFNAYLKSFIVKAAIEDNERYTQSDVTLYTPNASCTEYIIRQRSDDNTYSILWTNKSLVNFINQYNNTTFRYRLNIICRELNSAGASLLDINTTTLQYLEASSNSTYISPSYSTLEEAINAIQNPNTVYTFSSGTSFSSNTNFKPYTNVLYYTKDYTFDVTGNIHTNRKISNNETIEVIS